MAAKKIRLKIVTPKCLKLEEDVEMVIIRATTGEMGILPHHEARSAVLDLGLLRIINNDRQRVIAVSGGFAEIQNNCITILTGMAEWPEEINPADVKASLEAAKKIHQESKDSFEIKEAMVAIQRSTMLLEASSYELVDSIYHVKRDGK